MASCETTLTNASSHPRLDPPESILVDRTPDDVPPPPLVMQGLDHGSGNGNHCINQNGVASCRVVSPARHGNDHVGTSASSGDGLTLSCAPRISSHGDGAAATSSPTASTVSSGMNDKPAYHLLGCVMTEEQFETLRRQISVYATICSQLVEMHKALMAQQALLPSMMMGGQQPSFDSVLGARASGRQRWTPSQTQLQILENLFEKSNGTPSKQKLKAITAELGQHGSISETNVYNWFQNRKARAKRKQQHKDGESEVEPEDTDLRKDKRAAVETIQENNGFGRDQRDFSTIVVFIDAKPWEVPSTTLDLRGSFGDGVALLDSNRQVVHTDENGFTTCPLHAGENYTLVRLV